MAHDYPARRLYDETVVLAQAATMTSLTVGLGYTAVTTSDGGLGLAYMWVEGNEQRAHHQAYRDVEGECATELLDRLLSDDSYQRSLGLATVNALHQRRLPALADDDGSPRSRSLQHLGFAAGTRVSMVGYFPPLVLALPEIGIELDVIDSSLGLGDPVAFRERLRWWTDVLVMTATALLNGSAEELLMAADSRVRAVMMGPSTPLVPAAFSHLPLVCLAGIVPTDVANVVKVVRRGAATPGMRPFVRKVYPLCVGGPPSPDSLDMAVGAST